MSAFARAVLGSYNATPYHNMHHGFITFQSCYWAIKRCEIVGRCTTPLERLALLVAAIGHDARHDGVNNGFHVQKVIPTPSHVLGRISPIFSPFSPFFARFHRLAEAVPTSRKPEPRAKSLACPRRRSDCLADLFD